jgi:hypothetical protein
MRDLPVVVPFRTQHPLGVVVKPALDVARSMIFRAVLVQYAEYRLTGG